MSSTPGTHFDFGTRLGLVFIVEAASLSALAVTGAMRELKQDGSLARANQRAMGLEEYYELVGLKGQAAREEGYDRVAAAVVGKAAAQ